MRWPFLILFSMIFVCCKQQTSPPSLSQSTFKDSVVAEYLDMADSMEFYDTFNMDFKILKAYLKNDTFFFSSLENDMLQWHQKSIVDGPEDSCVIQTRLSGLKVNQAYRFKHWQAFCPFRQNITITLTDNKVLLHYIEYSNGNGQTLTRVKASGDTLIIKPYCNIVKEFDKQLSMNEWKEFENKIRDADYWGMKEKGGGGVDGSIWQIDAFVNHEFKSYGTQTSHSVWRHISLSECFKDLGLYMVKLSGEKTLCGDIF